MLNERRVFRATGNSLDGLVYGDEGSEACFQLKRTSRRGVLRDALRSEFAKFLFEAFRYFRHPAVQASGFECKEV